MKKIICAGLASAAAILITGCSNTNPVNTTSIPTISFENNSSQNDTASTENSSSFSALSSSSKEESSLEISSSSSEMFDAPPETSSNSSSATPSTADSSSLKSSESSSASSKPNVSSSSIPASSAKPSSVSSSTTVPKPVVFPEVYTEVEKITGGKLDTDYSYVIKDGETLHIRNGETLLINGLLNCEKGANIIVDSGGSLMLNGQIELSGDMTLYRGGELLLSNGSKVYGSGSASISSFNDIDCAGDFTARIIPPAPVTENGVTKVGDVLIVNKKHSIPQSYGSGLDPQAVAALNTMRSSSGYSMPIVSGFRSYEMQEKIFAGWCARDGVEVASTYSARPGTSEHQTGLAMDITSLEQSYGNTREGKWLAENCYKYGFIIRYPQGKSNITGYIYEPWHVRYLGKSTAKLVHDSGLTLEEFLGVEG